MKKNKGLWRPILWMAGAFFFAGWLWGCAAARPPSQPDDICGIFSERPDWRADAAAASAKWGAPVSVIMAVMRHESGYNAAARPPRTSCLWIFPGPRPSSAFGYPQALDTTWSDYLRDTGNRAARRDRFEDAADFIGWYCHMSHLRCGILKTDAFGLYLAYHEGHGGYNRKTYEKNPGVIRAARAVASRADQYERRLQSCKPLHPDRTRGCLQLF